VRGWNLGYLNAGNAGVWKRHSRVEQLERDGNSVINRSNGRHARTWPMRINTRLVSNGAVTPGVERKAMRCWEADDGLEKWAKQGLEARVIG
jgi:hypothetical protein